MKMRVKRLTDYYIYYMHITSTKHGESVYEISKLRGVCLNDLQPRKT